jgi:preprotein translocase subunit SecG
MGIGEIIVGALILILAIAIIIAILLQEGRRAGINGAISGGADTFLSRNKARSVNATLARFTKYIAIGFFVLIIIANIIALGNLK